MTYKGYSARIEYDDEDSILTGQIAGIRDGVGFHANSIDELNVAFHEAVDDYIDTCAKFAKNRRSHTQAVLCSGLPRNFTERLQSQRSYPAKA
jgi:predicted HicB family RNase H-like nuclease